LSAVVINIVGGEAQTYIEPGERIPSREPASLMAVVTDAAASFSEFLVGTLKPQITTIVADLNATMDQVKVLLSDENAVRVSSILENLESVSKEVDGITGGLGGTTEQVDKVLARLDTVALQISELIAANEEDLSKSVGDLHESLEAVARHADAIAGNLETTTRNMDEFSQQIREDPGVLLRGRNAAEEPAGSN
jgi:phospholipid/cholesterol/gamma-HCH transport system substrate-binding protein